jgi:dTDP-4-dehydrorhamnose reductase
MTALLWAITGARGLLGSQLAALLEARGDRVSRLVHHRSHGHESDIALDITDAAQCRRTITKISPDIIIHAAAIADVDFCERNEALAQAVNTQGSGHVAAAAESCGARLVHISTDQLWDGSRKWIEEREPVCPVNAYARTKADAERVVLDRVGNALILRTNFFGGMTEKRKSLSEAIRTTLERGDPFTGFTDVFTNPIAVPHFLDGLVELIRKGAEGIFNLPGSERLSKFEFAKRVAAHYGCPGDLVTPISVESMSLAARRPNEMSLNPARVEALLGRRMPTIEEGLRALDDQPEPAQRIAR